MSRPSAKGAWQGRITSLCLGRPIPSMALVAAAAEAKARYSVVQGFLPVNEHGSFGLPMKVLVTSSGPVSDIDPVWKIVSSWPEGRLRLP